MKKPSNTIDFDRLIRDAYHLSTRDLAMVIKLLNQEMLHRLQKEENE